MALVDLYNYGEADVWANGKVLRHGGGRWLGVEDSTIPATVLAMSGVQAVPAGMPPEVTVDEPIDEDEPVVLLLDEEPDDKLPDLRPTVVETPDTKVEDLLLSYGLGPVENLSVFGLADEYSKRELLELAADLEVAVSTKWNKTRISDRIYQAILDRTVRKKL